MFELNIIIQQAFFIIFEYVFIFIILQYSLNFFRIYVLYKYFNLIKQKRNEKCFRFSIKIKY